MATELRRLPGRREFFKALDGHLERSQGGNGSVGLVIVEVRRLREINIELGYEIGDIILGRLVEELKSMLRPSDLLAHVGGAEFALVLPELVSRGQAVLAVNRVSDICAQSFQVHGRGVKVKVACGVAVFPDDADTSEELTRRADIAASRAKALEKLYVAYAEMADEGAPPTLTLEADLEAAIQNGELENHYQPKIDLRSGTIVGVEALARWTTSIHGPVRPDIFVGVAERTGLIMPLTLWSLNTALRQARELHEKVGDLSVAINLSAGILNDPEVGDLVFRTMNIWDAKPGQVTLEVTESAMMADPGTSLQNLKELDARGIKVSIDDFGTGYSSLAYLKNLPVHELKVDRSFVMKMAEDEGDARIVRTIIDLAKNFEIPVVAEGVENQETFDSLAAMGCSSAQGFYMAKPMPLQDLMHWIDVSPWGRPPN